MQFTVIPRNYVIGGSETGECSRDDLVETDFPLNKCYNGKGGSRQSILNINAYSYL